MASIQYYFYYSAKDDVIQFTYQFQGCPMVVIQLAAEVFLKLFDNVSTLASPFILGVKENRAAGKREDIKTTFDVAKWENMMGEKEDG